MQIGFGKRSLGKSGVNMLHALCIIGLSYLAISCGMFRHSREIIYDYDSKSKVSISVLDNELNYMLGDTLLINAEILNGTNNDLPIAPSLPSWELYWTTGYAVDNLWFISVGDFNGQVIFLKPGEKRIVKCGLIGRNNTWNGFSEGKHTFRLYLKQFVEVDDSVYKYHITSSNELLINIVKGK